MGLFDKKFCDVCGEKIGMLGNRKLEDGNLCKDCAKKLSPWFSDRRHSTLQDIKNQLAYREQNRQNLNSFNPTRVIGDDWKVYIDDNQGKFCVSNRDIHTENADLIDLSQVVNVRSEVEEERDEIFDHDSEGNEVSYNPPRYEYTYQIYVTINVNTPYFDEIKFEVTSHALDRYTEQYRRCEQTANDIVNALSGMNAGGMNGGYNRMNQQNNMNAAMGMDAAMGGMNQGYNQQPQYNQQQGYAQPQQGYAQQPQYNQQGGYNQQPQQNAQWFCPNCGTQNNGSFCQSCGTPRP